MTVSLQQYTYQNSLLKMKVKEIYFQITMTKFYHQQTCMRTSEEICTLGGRKILSGTERKRLNKVKSTALLRSIRELRSQDKLLVWKLERQTDAENS